MRLDRQIVLLFIQCELLSYLMCCDDTFDAYSIVFASNDAIPVLPKVSYCVLCGLRKIFILRFQDYY